MKATERSNSQCVQFRIFPRIKAHGVFILSSLYPVNLQMICIGFVKICPYFQNGLNNSAASREGIFQGVSVYTFDSFFFFFKSILFFFCLC